MSKPSLSRIERHHRKWSRLARFPAISVLPTWDGDTAYLHHLRDAIFAALDNTTHIPHAPVGGLIYYSTVQRTGTPAALLISKWPEDVAAQQIAEWRCALDGEPA